MKQVVSALISVDNYKTDKLQQIKPKEEQNL